MPDPQGIIRLELQDSWQAREFARLLESIDTSYRLIWIVLDGEYRGFPFSRFYDDLLLFDRIGSMRLLLSDLPPWVGPSRAEEPRIYRLHLASPGYAEILASIPIIRTDCRLHN